MHLLPFMGDVSRIISPLLWEALCVMFTAMGYLIYYHKLSKYILLQPIIICTIFISYNIIMNILSISPVKLGFECSIIQGGYSRQDYALAERHPIISRKIAQKYLDHVKAVTNAYFVVLPESAFPIHQIEDGYIMRTIKDIAKLNNEYIMTGILLEENKNIYNTSVLINPKGHIESIYRKQNIVPFVETSKFTKGIDKNTFSIYEYTIAPIICFESLFIRNYFRDKKPELYIVISNDIFAEKTVLSQLHQAYSIINARTMKTPLLQVMQNGPSFYINSQNNLINLTNPYEKVIGLSIIIQ